MSTWYLIILLAGGVDGGRAAYHIEFAGKQACETARDAVTANREFSRGGYGMVGNIAVCVYRGAGQ